MGRLAAHGRGRGGGHERIGDRYYLMLGYGESKLGNRHASNALGAQQGMYTFVGERPEGPFRADTAAYRLLTCNTLGPLMAYFTRFYRLPDEVLVNHHSISRSDVRWIAPLKRAVVDEGGHLYLGYWPGNEAAKGPRIPLDLQGALPLWPDKPGSGWQSCPGCLEIDEPNGGAVVVLPGRFDLTRGVVLEGHVTVHEPAKRWSGAGLYVEEDAKRNRGTAFLAETRGCTEIGPLRKSGEGMVFVPDDVRPLGITAGKRCHWRLLIRQFLTEFYLDDRLVQCYSLPETVSGRLGLVVESGRARYDGLEAWQMSL